MGSGSHVNQSMRPCQVINFINQLLYQRLRSSDCKSTQYTREFCVLMFLTFLVPLAITVLFSVYSGGKNVSSQL